MSIAYGSSFNYICTHDFPSHTAHSEFCETMATTRTYLVTGANRGLGKGLVAQLLQRPSTTVVATVRDPVHAAPALNELPRADGAKLIVVKLDSRDTSGAQKAVNQLRSEYYIAQLDVVIANAAINNHPGPVAEMSVETMEDHFKVNTIGPITLFQAVRPLLKASKTGGPVFVPITSGLGSITGQDQLVGFPPAFSPYGATKAALNWFTRKIHFEEPWLISFVIHPGVVETDMMTSISALVENADVLGVITVETSVKNMLSVIDSASFDIGGTLKSHEGADLPW